MLWDKYNPDDFSEDNYGLIPEGRYRVRIDNAEEAVSHKGNSMIKLTLSVSGYKAKLWSYIVLNGTTPEQIKAINRRLGAIFNSFDIVEGGAQVRHTKDMNDNDRAEVQYFLYRKEVNKLPAWQEVGTQGTIEPDMVDFGDTASNSSGIPF